MKTGSSIRWVIATLIFSLINTIEVSAKPHNDPSVRPVAQLKNKHQTRPINRPERPQQRPPSNHRPPILNRPPNYQRPPHYHRPPVVARPPHHHTTYISVSRGYRYPPYRGHYYYYHRDLVDIATFAVFAGITYAIINDAFYQKSGDRYVYVRNPPAGNYTVIDRNDVVGTKSISRSNVASGSP